jgi:hypothetical protein
LISYEKGLVQEVDWDLMKKFPPMVRRIWIDGIISDRFTGIHTFYLGALVKSLVGSTIKELPKSKLGWENDTSRFNIFVDARYV